MLRLLTRAVVVLVGCSVMMPASSGAQRGKTVAVKASLKPSKQADQVTVVVEMDIKKGWHTYLSVGPDSTSPVTEVSLQLPDGATAIGGWNKPPGAPYSKEPGAMVLEGRAVFSLRVQLSDEASGSIVVKVRYQACDATKCLRPTSYKTSLDLPKRVAPQSPFEPPTRLMVGDVPVNVAAKQMYPSPAFYDVDSDGQEELVVGDIFGTLNVYENTNTSGKGDPVWAKHSPLKTADGEKIKVSNW